MSAHWDESDLEFWFAKIEELALKFGLNYFPQDFEICDYSTMIKNISLSGMPARYPHWSFGKTYEITNTKYKWGVGGNYYELVINSNPSLAYLVDRNTLAAQILVMAHVLGHNDFFKNNIQFSKTDPENAIRNFALRRKLIEKFREDPSIGPAAVENWLDAARAIEQNRALNLFEISKPENSGKIFKANGELVEPQGNLLAFVIDNNPMLQDWQKEILKIVGEEEDYFLPQIETKIMNEGWASFWHYHILHALNLSPDLHTEILRLHNNVVALPKDKNGKKRFNPYYVGFKMWQDIFWRYADSNERREGLSGTEALLVGGAGRQKLFEIREYSRDISFIMEFLTPRLANEFGLFGDEKTGEEAYYDMDIDVEMDKIEFAVIKIMLMRQLGINSTPVIKVVGVERSLNRELILMHYYDGRILDTEEAERVLEKINFLWDAPVSLLTWDPHHQSGCVIAYCWGENKTTWKLHCTDEDCIMKKHVRENLIFDFAVT